MTLILSAVIDSAICVAADSAVGQKDGTILLGSKVLCWSDRGILLTGYGDFDMPPTALSADYSRLSRIFSGTPEHGSRSTTMLATLNSHPHVHAQGGKSAGCLFFDFNDLGQPVVDVYSSVGAGPGTWKLEQVASPNMAAGLLDAIDLPSHNGRATLSRGFSSIEDFEGWSTELIVAASAWCTNKGLPQLIAPPMDLRVLRSPLQSPSA